MQAAVDFSGRRGSGEKREKCWGLMARWSQEGGAGLHKAFCLIFLDDKSTWLCARSSWLIWNMHAVFYFVCMEGFHWQAYIENNENLGYIQQINGFTNPTKGFFQFNWFIFRDNMLSVILLLFSNKNTSKSDLSRKWSLLWWKREAMIKKEGGNHK